MNLLRLALVWGAVGGVTGCFGELFILERDLGGSGPKERGCTIFNPDGECPAGLRCCDGVCAADCDSWNCACQPEQACVAGECQDITPEVECSPAKPDGLCPMGQVCIGGTCVPLSGKCGCDPPTQACVDGECIDIPPERACSVQNLNGLCRDGYVCLGGVCIEVTTACSSALPNGLCPPEATCVNGRCIPIDERPCGPDRLDGLCPNCEICQAPGQCVPVLCSPAYPLCGCAAARDYCVAGQCVCLPCNSGNVNGCCPDDEFCSTAGYCIPDGGCATSADCRMSGVLCSCEGQCINEGTCYCDSDCGLYHYCPVPGDLCQRDLRCPNGDVDCPPSEYCDASATCRLDGTCGTTADCDDLPGTFCSACEECIPVGRCCENTDCTAGADPYCSTANTCLDRALNQCASTFDCPPGQVCDGGTCIPGGRLCTANGAASCVDVGGETFWCCPTGTAADCCPQGFICGAGGTCIPLGDCVDSGDCHPSFTCSAEFKCVPVTPCAGSCASGVCSQAGGCIPDDGSCVVNADCPAGEVCGALYQCEPAVGCGDQEFEATVVPPNMLTVLDRSGSMSYCDDSLEPEWRWIIARAALGTMLTANDGAIRFGLSTYPYYCPGSIVCGVNDCDDTCNNDCDWRSRCDNPCSPFNNNSAGCAQMTGICEYSGTTCRWVGGGTATQTACERFPPCRWIASGTYNGANRCDPKATTGNTGSNRAPGDVDVAVGEGTVAAIITALAPPGGATGRQHPGGYTPTGRTLRNIATKLGQFGLNDTERGNYALLVTDGDANNAGGTFGVCDGYSNAGDEVNCALDALRNATPSVRTFVVGFVEGSPTLLNCHAVHGGTSRCATRARCAAIGTQSVCQATLGCTWSGGACAGGIEADNCATNSVTCFYRADDAASLLAAFANIASTVASCSYSLDSVPEDSERLTVYFYHQCASQMTEGECTAAPGCAWVGGTCAGDPVWLPRDRTRTDNWDYDVTVNQVVFAGAACDQLQAGGVTPVVILGCRIGE